MIKIILSPAKKLATKPFDYGVKASQPIFQREVTDLIDVLQKKSASQLQQLMGISERLASLNYQRYQQFNPTRYQADNAYPALFNFKGDVYQSLDVDSLGDHALDFAHQHLVILSGLYGLLRPFDLMQDYRLEMGTRLQIGDCPNLYAFWQQQLTSYFNKEFSTEKKPILINLASMEYAKAIDFKQIQGQVIHIDFKEQKPSGLKTIGILAKRARGMMARFILENQVTSTEQLISFSQSGYAFRPDLSNEQRYVFVADRQES